MRKTLGKTVASYQKKRNSKQCAEVMRRTDLTFSFSRTKTFYEKKRGETYMKLSYMKLVLH